MELRWWQDVVSGFDYDVGGGTRRVDYFEEGGVVVEFQASSRLDDVKLVQLKN